MILAVLSLDSASHSLAWSNVLYVVGALLTLGSAGMVLYEKRSRIQGLELRWGLATETIVIVAAFISFTGTVGALLFGHIVSGLKDAALTQYEKAADVKIADANSVADSARVLATQTANDNLKLEQELQEHEAHERSYEQQQQATTKATHRTIPDPKEFSLALEKLPKDVRVTLVQNLADDEAGRLLRQLYDIFVAAGFSPSRGGFMGSTSSDPVSIPGIHLHCTLDPSADMMCNSLVKQFKAAGMKPDRETAGSLRNEQFPTGLPGPSAAVWIYVGPAQ
jgi:hypothetical protein